MASRSASCSVAPWIHQRGFTYVGLMIFVAIIALASVATLSAGSAMQRRMNEDELLFVGTQFAAAFRSYYEATPAGQRNYPAKLEELLRDPRYPGIRRHLRRIYGDPVTGKAEWGLVTAAGGVIGVHSLSREAPLKVAQFDAELVALADKKSYADVETNLADLQAQVLKHREELTFYRGIVSPEDGIGGLRIQRFQVLAGGVDNHYRLRLVLVQSMRQDTVVSGSVSIQIEGVRENKPVQLMLTEAGGETRADGQVPFQFRYFQNLEQDVVLPEGFEPRAVTVEVRSPRQAPVRESYPWQVQAGG